MYFVFKYIFRIIWFCKVNIDKYQISYWVGYMSRQQCLSKDILLISEISPHAVELLLSCLSVHVPDVFQDLQQCLLHGFGHLDLPADVDVATFAVKTCMKQPRGFYLYEFYLLDPVVVDLDGIPGDQILNVLLGMIDLPGVGHLPLKVETSTLFDFREKTEMIITY